MEDFDTEDKCEQALFNWCFREGLCLPGLWQRHLLPVEMSQAVAVQPVPSLAFDN